jgi:predicted RNA-binding Zn-ribbon protein involved in translation (DUF1610 family)
MIRKIKKYYCPKCKVNLRGGLIPKKIRHHYGATHWGRELGRYDYRLDRTVAWQCPDCKHEWKRVI